MPDVRVDWVIVGVDEFADILENLADRGQNLSPATQKVGEMWQEWIEEQFETQGVRFLGHRWTKLSNETIRRKKSTTILIESSNLLLETTDPGNIHADDDGVTFIIEVDYGHFHQTGTDRMPQREILHLSPLDVKRSIDVVEDYLINGHI
jgi:phage gpG-like protein